jgi:hypothetical protein
VSEDQAPQYSADELRKMLVEAEAREQSSDADKQVVSFDFGSLFQPAPAKFHFIPIGTTAKGQNVIGCVFETVIGVIGLCFDAQSLTKFAREAREAADKARIVLPSSADISKLDSKIAEINSRHA